MSEKNISIVSGKCNCCGKALDLGNWITEDGKDFCCFKCIIEYFVLEFKKKGKI